MAIGADGLVLIVGCGDTGRRVAALELAAGAAVTALTRSDAAARELAALGITPVRGDLDVPGSLTDLPPSPAVLYYLAPPPPTGVSDPRLAALLSSLRPGKLPGTLVYISTSGVYGDCHGAWVTEDWPLNPQSDRARRRAAAETLLRDWRLCHRLPFVILRVPGIYGPGRLPIERIRQGIPVVREDESPFSNRIHVDDLAAACFAAARTGLRGQPYNISDGDPTSMTDYFYRVADSLGLPRPPAITMAEAHRVLSPGMLSFLMESKRLDNRRMVQELGVKLRYPDLVSGLAASVATTPLNPPVS